MLVTVPADAGSEPLRGTMEEKEDGLGGQAGASPSMKAKAFNASPAQIGRTESDLSTTSTFARTVSCFSTATRTESTELSSFNVSWSRTDSCSETAVLRTGSASQASPAFLRTTSVANELEQLSDLLEEQDHDGDDGVNVPMAGKRKVLFRTDVPKNVNNKLVIKFNQEMDVEVDRIVNAYNLDPEVKWPQLTSFCSKNAGITPTAIRMMRRTSPPRAMLVFKTAAEATHFVESVPENCFLRKTKPIFQLKGRKQPFGGEQINPREYTQIGEKKQLPAPVNEAASPGRSPEVA